MKKTERTTVQYSIQQFCVLNLDSEVTKTTILFSLPVEYRLYLALRNMSAGLQETTVQKGHVWGGC